tara:strand:- start:167 stop:373 length:207 start_codon:yes stop_codon:yes gene_type:complete
MGLENYTIKTNKIHEAKSKLFFEVQSFVENKVSGLNFFEKLLIFIYTLMTLVFLGAAVFLVLSEGFKY